MSETENKSNAPTCEKNSKPKPCCVCIEEKTARDQCLLLNGQDSGKCDDLIASYKACMKGYGFTI